MAIHLSNPNIWIVKVSGEQYLLLASDEQEARRLAGLVGEITSVERSAIPLLTVEEEVVPSGGLEYIEKRRVERERSTWR